jgi:hypothetical protein
LTAATDFVGEVENIAGTEGDRHKRRIHVAGKDLELTDDNDAARDDVESHPVMGDGGEDHCVVVKGGRYLLWAEDLVYAWVVMHRKSTFFAASQLCVSIVPNF